MGIRGSLTEITPDMFQTLLSGSEIDYSTFFKGCTKHWVDKAWGPIDEVLRNKPFPLNLAMLDDSQPPKFPEYVLDCDDSYERLVPPEMVKAIHECIDLVTDVEELFTSYGISSDDYYEIYNFNELKKAYRHAAENGNALYIHIC